MAGSFRTMGTSVHASNGKDDFLQGENVSDAGQTTESEDGEKDQAGLLAGCGSNSKEQESNPVVQSEQTTGEKESEEETDVSGGIDIEDTAMEETESNDADGKTIVVYFSATGNTEQVATVIAEATGGGSLHGQWMVLSRQMTLREK